MLIIVEMILTRIHLSQEILGRALLLDNIQMSPWSLDRKQI